MDKCDEIVKNIEDSYSYGSKIINRERTFIYYELRLICTEIFVYNIFSKANKNKIRFSLKFKSRDQQSYVTLILLNTLLLINNPLRRK